MASDDIQGHGSLEQQARAQFGSLSAAELKLVRAAPKGEIAYCGPSHDDNDPHNDPGKADQWGPARQIRAELIRWLCLDRRARDRVDKIGVALHAAKIVGKLDLSFATVVFPLQLWRSALTHDANLIQVEIPFLDFEGSWVRSVSASGASVRAALFLHNGFHAQGTVSLYGAKIGVILDCRHGTFVNPPRKELPDSGLALNAENITMSGALFLSTGFRAEGEVRLSGAQIHGTLDCAGGAFINPPAQDLSASGTALNAERASVDGNMLLSKGFRAEGEARLKGIQVGGTLDCSGGTFVNPLKRELSGSGTALNVDGISVNGDLFFSAGFRAEGEVRLSEGQIGGSFESAGGTFINPGGTALGAEGITVKGNVMLYDAFRAEGRVDLTVSRIGGDFVCRNTILKAATLDFRDATVSSILDNEQSWPERGKLYLDGLVYRRIAEGPRDADSRLRWLSLQPEKPFARQPYLQLAKVLREAGDDDGARRVLIAMNDRQWKSSEAGQGAATLQRWPLRATVGYGYRPLWAFWEILGLSALGWIVYRRSYLAGNMVPTDKDAYQSFKSDSRPPTHYTAFAPLVYSLENSLPLVKLGQAEKWQPDPSSSSTTQRSLEINPHHHRTWPRSLSWLHRFLILAGLQVDPNLKTLPSRPNRWGTSPRFVRWFIWIQILLGWLLATFLLAGVTGIVRTE